MKCSANFLFFIFFDILLLYFSAVEGIVCAASVIVAFENEKSTCDKVSTCVLGEA